MNDLWAQLSAAAGLALNEAQHAQLDRYLDLLEQANQRMNLTRITDRAAARVQHVGDALTLLPHLPAGAVSLADVGSGGGVPGLPLAIARPQLRVTLIESTRKKAAFLREAAGELGLANVTVLDERAEDVARSARRETFDIAVARAVAELVWLAEWCLPLLKTGGAMLAMKGERAAAELPAATAAAKLLGGGVPVVHPVALPGTQHHVIVEIRKTRPSPAQYPRPATTAKGKALR
jgi:16S rRNA (guanine527-N7)-methyltransferase